MGKILLRWKEKSRIGPAKSYIKKGFLTYEEIREYEEYVYEDAIDHHILYVRRTVQYVWICTRSLPNFFIVF